MILIIFVDPILAQHFYKLGFSDLCIRVENDILNENNALSLYDQYDHALAKDPLPRGNKIYQNFGISFLGYQNYILSLSVVCSGVEKKVFKQMHQF